MAEVENKDGLSIQKVLQLKQVEHFCVDNGVYICLICYCH